MTAKNPKKSKIKMAVVTPSIRVFWGCFIYRYTPCPAKPTTHNLTTVLRNGPLAEGREENKNTRKKGF